MTRKVNTKRKESREHRATETAEQECNRNHDRHLAENEVDCRQEAKRRARICNPQNRIIDSRKKHEMHSDNRQKPKVLAHDKRCTANGF